MPAVERADRAPVAEPMAAKWKPGGPVRPVAPLPHRVIEVRVRRQPAAIGVARRANGTPHPKQSVTHGDRDDAGVLERRELHLLSGGRRTVERLFVRRLADAVILPLAFRGRRAIVRVRIGLKDEHLHDDMRVEHDL